MQGGQGPDPLGSVSAAWEGHVGPAPAGCSQGHRVTGSNADRSFPVSEPRNVHTSSGTTNPCLGKPKALASSQPPLGCKSTSGGESVVCHGLHIGRDGALVTARGLQGGGMRGPGTSEFSTHSEPRLHSPEHTKLAEQPRWNRTQLGPLRCALRIRPDVSF